MEIIFSRIELSDQSVIQQYLDQVEYRSADLTFANVYLWQDFYKVTYAIVRDMLVFQVGEQRRFSYPIGKKNPKETIDALIAYADQEGFEFEFSNLTCEMYENLNQLYPEQFQIIYQRSEADYIYKVEDLIRLSGSKYHGKKNHVNNFNKNHDWNYEKITDENVEECIKMLLEWGTSNQADEDESKESELLITKKALMLREELHLVGGAIRAEGAIVAFTLGEPINSDTFDIHFEKAFAQIQGAYPIINQQFLIHEVSDYLYVNREEDMGSAGLRKAKLSYHPESILEKGYVVRACRVKKAVSE